MSDMRKLLGILTEGDMKSAEKKSTGPKFVGKWKGTDSQKKAKDKLVGGESILRDLEKSLKEDSHKRNLLKEFENFKQGAQNNPQDVVKVDIPLFIRLLEYAKEDAKTDMDLHNVAERLIKMCATGKTVSMDQYDTIVGSQEKIEEYGGVGGYGAASQAPQGAGNVDPNDPETQQLKLDQTQLQKSTQAIAPSLNAQGGTEPVNKVKFQGVMDKLDVDPTTKLTNQDQASVEPLATAAKNVLKNPATAAQVKQLFTKASQANQQQQAWVQKQKQQIGTNQPAKPGQPQQPGQVLPGQQQKPGTV